MFDWIKDWIYIITGAQERHMDEVVKKINDGRLIVWGNMAFPIEDIRSGKTRLILNDVDVTDKIVGD